MYDKRGDLVLFLPFFGNESLFLCCEDEGKDFFGSSEFVLYFLERKVGLSSLQKVPLFVLILHRRANSRICSTMEDTTAIGAIFDRSFPFSIVLIVCGNLPTFGSIFTGKLSNCGSCCVYPLGFLTGAKKYLSLTN